MLVVPGSLRVRFPRPASLVVFALVAATRVAPAQVTPPAASTPAAAVPAGPPDVVRGRVLDDSARALANAAIIITRGPDRLVKQTTTDSAGRYSVRFDPGTGDYLVAVSAPSFRSARRRVQREGNERELVADFTLGRDLAMLAAVQVRGERPVRASAPVGPTQQEAGSSERWNEGVSGQLSPTQAGDLNAMALAMPGITMTPSGPSILGAAGESNLTMLNGLGISAAQIPRAARTDVRVTGATFDPTRGGFSGAQIDVRLGPGSRNYQQRNAFFTIDAPQLQFTDAVGRSAGAPNGGFRGSVGADGELIRQTLTYNVAVDVARSASDPSTLLGADEATLLRAGISPDSVASLVSVASRLAVPLSSGGIPGSRQRDNVTWLGRLDDTRDSLKGRTLTSYASYTHQGAIGFGPLSAPATAGESRERTLGAQVMLRDYFGPGKRVLNNARASFSGAWNKTDPYRALPGASVLVRSTTLDDRNDVTSVSLGGNPFIASDQSTWTAEAANETAWFMHGNKQRFKAILWGRGDGLTQQPSGNLLGSYSYNSIADFSAGRPSSFSRTLSAPDRHGVVWNGAAALAHQWVPSRWFNLLYGARVEGNWFGEPPAKNAALESALGVRTGIAPSLFHVSPRVGFTYTYNRSKDNGNGTNQSNVGRFYRLTQGVVRGGIGEFRDLLRPNLLADATAATGLPGGTTSLSCVGAAVPLPDWTSFAADPSSIPSQCAGGGGVLAERAPSATLIGPKFDVPRSWRASMDWSSNIKKMLVRVSTLASYDLSQPGTVDANFGGTSRFTLADEGNRPVYVTPASIDAASGAVSAAEARRSSAFGRVGVRTSDLRGYGGQMTVTVSPDVFKARLPHSIFASLSFTEQSMRRQFRGFDGAGFGDPRAREWAAGPNDARHVVLLQGGFSGAKTGTVSFFARAQSGLPFTPIVQGDVNGDGRGGDRAFIPSVSERSGQQGDAATVAALRSLMADGSTTARECINAYAGQVAARNGCRGPWSQSLNVQWRPPIPRKWMGRLTANVYLQNALGGIDQLVNGDNLKGWGSSASPDPVLLVARGFDANARRFRYDVNPRFGDTRGARTLVRDPFRISIDFSLNLSTDYDVQELRRALEPVKRGRTWERRSADSLTAFYLSNTSDIHRALLTESDSLFLSKEQIAALRKADSAYSAKVREIYIPLGQYLSQFQDGIAGKAALDSVSKSRKAYWKIFWTQPEIAAETLNAMQLDLFPMLKNMLQIPQKNREGSQWFFGSPVLFTPSAARGLPSQ